MLKRFGIGAMALVIFCGGCHKGAEPPATMPTPSPEYVAPPQLTNLILPPAWNKPADPKAADASALAKLVASGRQYLIREQAKTISDWHLQDCDSFDLNPQTGELVFKQQGAPQVRAKVQVIGLVGNDGGLWKWAWAVSPIPAELTTMARQVQEYGKANQLEALTQESWKAEETSGWDMAAVAAAQSQAKAAYRAPSPYGSLYVVLTELHTASAQP